MQMNYVKGLKTPMATLISDNISNSCSPLYLQQCIPQETVIRNVMLARAYVPFQKFCSIFSPDMALNAGTAFPELYQPYHPTKNNCDHPIIPLREESNHVLE